MIKLEEILHHYPEITSVHPACEAVPPMSEEDYDVLRESIRARGLLRSMILTVDGQLLDGRHRLLACYEEFKEARFEYKDVLDPWNFVYDLNIAHRHLTVGQKAMFAEAMRIHEESLAKERQRASGGDQKSEKAKKSVEATLPQPIEKPKRAPQPREKVAQKVGVGQKAIDKAKVISQYAPSIGEKVKSGELDLEPAYREANKVRKEQKSHPVEKLKLSVVDSEEKARIVTLNGDIKEIPKPKSVRFNQTNDSIDWAHWSWNPITGCLHGCSFCYAREIATSTRMEQFYPFGFDPAFHEYRLSAPRHTKKPDSDDARDGRVFVCSMADLFGKWVPEEWIKSVFDACLASPDWEYLFLTKWPNRYSQMPLLEKAWYGASVIQQSDVARIEKAMRGFDADGITKWVSMEPMLEPIKFNDLSWCNLVVIGSQTSTNQPDGFHPAIPANFDYVVDVVNKCRESGVPYYLKANLGLESPGMKLPKMLPISVSV